MGAKRSELASHFETVVGIPSHARDPGPAARRPDGLVVADLPEPDGDAPLVVEVRAAGVGFPDLLMSRGEYQIRQEPPFTLGWEAAGVVARAPEGSVLEPGDRVVTLTFGAFAERIAAVPEATFALPDTLSFEEGAGYPLNYLTAIAGLKRRGRLTAGESVLVEGASGGVGTAAIQVAKALGARAIGLVSTRRRPTSPGPRAPTRSSSPSTAGATASWISRTAA